MCQNHEDLVMIQNKEDNIRRTLKPWGDCFRINEERTIRTDTIYLLVRSCSWQTWGEWFKDRDIISSGHSRINNKDTNISRYDINHDDIVMIHNKEINIRREHDSDIMGRLFSCKWGQILCTIRTLLWLTWEQHHTKDRRHGQINEDVVELDNMTRAG